MILRPSSAVPARARRYHEVWWGVDKNVLSGEMVGGMQHETGPVVVQLVAPSFQLTAVAGFVRIPV